MLVKLLDLQVEPRVTEVIVVRINGGDLGQQWSWNMSQWMKVDPVNGSQDSNHEYRENTSNDSVNGHGQTKMPTACNTIQLQ